MQPDWAKNRVQCEEKNKVLKNPPEMGGCHREHIKPSYVCPLPLPSSAVNVDIISIQCFVLISVRVVPCANRDQMCHFSGLSLCNHSAMKFRII